MQRQQDGSRIQLYYECAAYDPHTLQVFFEYIFHKINKYLQMIENGINFNVRIYVPNGCCKFFINQHSAVEQVVRDKVQHRRKREPRSPVPVRAQYQLRTVGGKEHFTSNKSYLIIKMLQVHSVMIA